MKYKVMKAWVKALRSGDYEQTTGKLSEGGAFCCLGVLCDLYRKDKKVSKEEALRGFCGLKNVPCENVVKWAGLSANNPCARDEVISLAEYNDDLGKSFVEIADIIEAKYKSL